MVSPLHPQVSFGSDLSNRAPTFDMDLADLFDSEGEPIAYDVANKYFDQDASQKNSFGSNAGAWCALPRQHKHTCTLQYQNPAFSCGVKSDHLNKMTEHLEAPP
jgi:hypothetical protein